MLVVAADAAVAVTVCELLTLPSVVSGGSAFCKASFPGTELGLIVFVVVGKLNATTTRN